MRAINLRWAALPAAFVVFGAFPLPAALARAESTFPQGELWVARYNGTASSIDEANDMAVGPDGARVFVTGRSTGTTSSDVATVSYDAVTGAELWVTRYDSAHGYDEGRAVAVSSDGARVFVAGTIGNPTTTAADYLLLALDATTGAILWSRRYAGSAHSADVPYAVVVSPNSSKVFVTGESRGTTIYPDWATVAYDAATGTPLWLKRLDGPAKYFDSARAMAISPDGSKLFVTGYGEQVFGNDDYLTVAYDAVTGNVLWLSWHDWTAYGDDATAMAISPDGTKVFVTGFTTVFPYTFDYATIALDASTGTELWAQRYDGPDSKDDIAHSVALSPDGSRVFVTGESGSSGSPGNSDYATLAYDAATGTMVWLRRFGTPAGQPDVPDAVAVTPDGSMVFVAGSATDGSGYSNYVSLAYAAATGGTLGLRTYNGPRDQEDVATGLVVSPDGSKTFVTGYSRGPVGSSLDYATVAYKI